jgi:hypothetical protein
MEPLPRHSNGRLNGQRPIPQQLRLFLSHHPDQELAEVMAMYDGCKNSVYGSVLHYCKLDKNLEEDLKQADANTIQILVGACWLKQNVSLSDVSSRDFMAMVTVLYLAKVKNVDMQKIMDRYNSMQGNLKIVWENLLAQLDTPEKTAAIFFVQDNKPEKAVTAPNAPKPHRFLDRIMCLVGRRRGG